MLTPKSLKTVIYKFSADPIHLCTIIRTEIHSHGDFRRQYDTMIVEDSKALYELTVGQIGFFLRFISNKVNFHRKVADEYSRPNNHILK